MLEKIKGKGFVALERSPWPDGAADAALPARNEKILWDGGKLAWVGADGTRHPAGEVKPEKGYAVSPAALYAAIGEDTVIVEILQDPDDYTEMNAVSEYVVIDLGS